MELVDLRIRDFRNLAAVDLKPNPHFNIVVGANGQGKTNVLEAIYFLSAAKSFRAPKSVELLRWGTALAEVSGTLDRAGHRRDIRIEIGPRGRRLRLDGLTVRNPSDYLGHLGTVVFAPDDLLMLKGSPAGRRRFLDRAVFNSRAGYLADAQAYDKVLKQRNALLRDPRPSPLLIEVYDEQLSELGALVTQRRLQYVDLFRPFFGAAFSAIYEGQDSEPGCVVEIDYASQWLLGVSTSGADDTIDDLQARLAQALEMSVSDDRRRGFTTVGPHRDDLELRLGGREVKAYASQGQTRAMVLAMKIAEIRLLQERFGIAPVLLLDDVSSELDRDRNRHLFSFLHTHRGQVFITTTHRDHILIDQDATVFDVERGEVQPRRVHP